MADFLADFDPKSQPPAYYRGKFRVFLEEFELDQVESLLLQTHVAQSVASSSSSSGMDGFAIGTADVSHHYSVTINFQDLTHFDPGLAYCVLHHPKLLLPIFEEALDELQVALSGHPAFRDKVLNAYCSPRQGDQSSANMGCTVTISVKQNSHIRLVSLPPVSELCKATIGDIRSHEVDSLIQVSGTVVRTGGVRMLELIKQYECQNPRCRYRFTVRADPEQDHMLPQPRTCPSRADLDGPGSSNSAHNGGRGGGGGRGFGGRGPGREGGKKCQSTNLREVEGSRVCVDYQEIKVRAW